MNAALHDQAAELRLLVASHEAGGRASGGRPQGACVVAVASGKGGVGKTSIAVNLALRLARIGRRVVLIDADLGTANAGVLLNVEARYDVSDVLRGRRTLEEATVRIAPRLRLLAGASGLAEAADATPAACDRVIDQFSGLEEKSDLIVLDCGAGISRSVLTFAGSADDVLVVTTPDPTAWTDAYALIKALHHNACRASFNLVVNQVDSAREGRCVADRIASVAGRFLHVAVDQAGTIRRDRHVADAVRRRVPLIINDPTCPAATAVSALAERVARRARTARGPGFFRRVLGCFN